MYLQLLSPILLGLALLPTTLLAQSNSPENLHPIEVKMNNCIDKNPSTAGVTGCLDTAYTEWDAELNKFYKLLTGIINTTQKTALRNAERAWLEYRDKEFALLELLYQTKEGSMFQPMLMYDKVTVVKKRALELEDHYKLLTEY